MLLVEIVKNLKHTLCRLKTMFYLISVELTDVLKRSFKCRGAIAWNNLPDQAQIAVSTESFKYSIKKQN